MLPCSEITAGAINGRIELHAIDASVESRLAAIYDSYRQWKAVKRGEVEARAAHRKELKQEIAKHLATQNKHP
jgi:hypothetical protein